MTAIAASAPVLLRHTGSSDWSDSLLGMLVGIAAGIGAVAVVMALRGVRNAS